MAEVRPIDANALRKKAREMDLCAAVTVWDIDEAPTISPDSLRPKGRWENFHYDYSYDFDCYVHDCSVCGNPHRFTSHFCPNCGADMREGTK